MKENDKINYRRLCEAKSYFKVKESQSKTLEASNYNHLAYVLICNEIERMNRKFRIEGVIAADNLKKELL